MLLLQIFLMGFNIMKPLATLLDWYVTKTLLGILIHILVMCLALLFLLFFGAWHFVSFLAVQASYLEMGTGFCT